MCGNNILVTSDSVLLTLTISGISPHIAISPLETHTHPETSSMDAISSDAWLISSEVPSLIMFPNAVAQQSANTGSLENTVQIPLFPKDTDGPTFPDDEHMLNTRSVGGMLNAMSLNLSSPENTPMIVVSLVLIQMSPPLSIIMWSQPSSIAAFTAYLAIAPATPAMGPTLERMDDWHICCTR